MSSGKENKLSQEDKSFLIKAFNGQAGRFKAHQLINTLEKAGVAVERDGNNVTLTDPVSGKEIVIAITPNKKWCSANRSLAPNFTRIVQHVLVNQCDYRPGYVNEKPRRNIPPP